VNAPASTAVAPNAVVEIKPPGGEAVRIGNALQLAVIAGPCQLESRQHALETAQALKSIAERLGIGLIYKTSFDKANRTSGGAQRGVGLKAALPIFAEIRETLGLPVLTDVHAIDQCAAVAEAVDVLQIPAFLCRQTDLLIAAARTGRAVNIKKGQFLAPWDMKNVVAKVTDAGNPNVMACERGVSFGYNTLVSDMRALPVLSAIGCPVVFDAAAGRAGRQFRRSARVCAGAGPCGRCGGRGLRLHGNPPRSGPRPIGRPQYGAASRF
jgi:2-dehydro-3-deoxyphosphooctonate aldolase (KDO 8-P synthase)